MIGIKVFEPHTEVQNQVIVLEPILDIRGGKHRLRRSIDAAIHFVSIHIETVVVDDAALGKTNPPLLIIGKGSNALPILTKREPHVRGNIADRPIADGPGFQPTAGFQFPVFVELGCKVSGESERHLLILAVAVVRAVLVHDRKRVNDAVVIRPAVLRSKSGETFLGVCGAVNIQLPIIAEIRIIRLERPQLPPNADLIEGRRIDYVRQTKIAEVGPGFLHQVPILIVVELESRRPLTA